MALAESVSVGTSLVRSASAGTVAVILRVLWSMAAVTAGLRAAKLKVVICLSLDFGAACTTTVTVIFRGVPPPAGVTIKITGLV